MDVMGIKNLVYTSAGDNTRFYKDWTEKNRNYDIWVTYYGNDETNYKKYKDCVDFINKRKGFKFQNFYDLYSKKDLSQYDRIFILDDDIIINTTNINRMFDVSKTYNLNICAPTFSTNSKISHPKTKNNPKWFMRYTNYVEVNTPLFNKSALDKLMKVFDPRLVGWGIDRLAAWANDYKKIALIDNITCINPYDKIKGGIRELTKGDKSWSERANIWHNVAEYHGIEPRLPIKNWSYINEEEGNKMLSLLHDKELKFSKNQKDKIAFLMLGYKTLNYPNIWYDFLNEGSDRCSFYSHIKKPEECISNFLYDVQIKKHIDTKYATISIVKATNNMLEEAYKDKTNKIFILTSADALPLYKFEKVYNDLIKQEQSWLSLIKDRGDCKICTQFFLLTRDHVKIILENRDREDKHHFKKTVPDETYYYDVLKDFDEENINLQKRVIEYFIEGKSNRCIERVLPSKVDLRYTRKEHGAYFVRKIRAHQKHLNYKFISQEI